MRHTMTDIDPIAMAALARMREKAEPKLAAALARHGVSAPNQLPAGLAAQIFQDTMLQTAAENFPGAQLDALRHGLNAFRHPLFGPAFDRLRSHLASKSDAFEMASGPDAAIVLAAFGLPVAPFNRKQPRILAEPTNDIDQVAAAFAKLKTAFVGYSPCDAPFYMLVTDCVRTMHPQIGSRPQLSEARMLLERGGVAPPAGPFPSFRHGIALIAREPGDAISTIFLNNPNPQEGSIELLAGWTIKGKRDGAPNNGFMPVPLQFLQGVIQDAQLALWIWRPVGVRIMLN